MFFTRQSDVTILFIFSASFRDTIWIHQKSIWRFSEGALQTPVHPENGEGPRFDTGGLLHAMGFCLRSTHHICKTPAYPAGVLKERRRGRDSNPRINFTKNQSDVFQAPAFDHSATPPFEDPRCQVIFFLAGIYYITAIPPYVVPDV